MSAYHLTSLISKKEVKVMSGIVTAGTVAFSNLTEFDVYMGKSTGKYNLVITMEPEAASKLEDMGVKVKDYEGKAQRKFTSKYNVSVVDIDDQPVAGEIPYGSKVRILWSDGPVNPEYGVPTYMNKVRVVEFAEGGDDGEVPSDF
jgi:hypothetical protein